MKRRKAAPTPPAESTEPAPPAESTEPAPLAPLAPTALTRGIIRKSAVRRWLKTEAAQPVKIREAFFAALEAKVTADLARSLARAREQKRSTLMGSDA
jgi:hypothetical protein